MESRIRGGTVETPEPSPNELGPGLGNVPENYSGFYGYSSTLPTPEISPQDPCEAPQQQHPHVPSSMMMPSPDGHQLDYHSHQADVQASRTGFLLGQIESNPHQPDYGQHVERKFYQGRYPLLRFV